MKNSTVTLLLAYAFLIGAIFENYDTFIICASIFMSAHFIIKQIEGKK